MENRRQEERSTGTRAGGLGQRHWVRRLAWLVALLLAVAASVVALSRRAESFEPQHYRPTPELATAFADYVARIPQPK